MVKAVLTGKHPRLYSSSMSAIEFTIELTEKPVLAVPQEVADQLPKTGRARVIVITNGSDGDSEWQAAAYEQFLRDDSPDDSIYDSLR
jgi:hypothetical protein